MSLRLHHNLSIRYSQNSARMMCQLPLHAPMTRGWESDSLCMNASSAVQLKKAPGNAQIAYEAPRQRANGAMLAALDGLKRVFEPQSGLLSGLRGLGLDAINALPGAKQRIVRYAMGL